MKKVFAREELCVNCHLCEVYCKTAHSASGDVLTANKYENPAPISRVKVYGDRVASVAVNCRHCDDPACVKACITGAMHKDKKTGIVSVDPDKCIGCMTWRCAPSGVFSPAILPTSATCAAGKNRRASRVAPIEPWFG